MFTGLVEEIGKVKALVMGEVSAEMTITASRVLEDIHIGDSISTNGVCLTVTAFDEKSFSIDVMPETMRSSNLKSLKVGNNVNLERALKVGTRLGGHIVSGHIDGVGIIRQYKQEDNATWVRIEAPNSIMKYIVHKGSVAIDGISLTVAALNTHMFSVSIIPLTRDDTTLLKKKVGDEVNIECDIVGKYIERLMLFKTDKPSNKREIDKAFLEKSGFLDF